LIDEQSVDDVAETLRAAGCVFAEAEAGLLVEAATTPEDLLALVEQRVGGLPLEQVLGWAEFCGRRIAVEPGVFVPRRRTELLVREAARLCSAGSIVVDLCCGSGAVGVVLASTVPQLELYAVDIDPVSVRCARGNLDGAGTVLEGDLDAPLPATLRGRVDVMVANAPYVPSGELELMPREARAHEPLVALDGGTDGVQIHRRIAAIASRWLRPGGWLGIETSGRQASATADAMSRNGLTPRTVTDDSIEATVVSATRA
jgi:release factor glutamine methyltransferase